VVKYVKFKRLQWAAHLVQMDNTRILKKVLNEDSVEEDPWEDHV
jgi:hypothetical protein